jgi:hypothetical protein
MRVTGEAYEARAFLKTVMLRLALRPGPLNGHAKESRDHDVGVEFPQKQPTDHGSIT